MSGFPSVNFGQPESGLFSPGEIARLMESEYQRSVRHDYPLSVLCVEIDRLESLHDLYGVESEQRILRAVAGLLRSSTRASDVMGLPRGPRLVILLPHTPRAGAVAIARRLLAGCRELEFRGDGRDLRASLSIGIAARAAEGSLGQLVEAAEQALRTALAAGGDRLLEFERLPAATRVSLPAAPGSGAAPAPAPAVPARSAPRLPAAADVPGATLEEKVQSLLRLAGGSAAVPALEREILTVLRETLAEGRGSQASRAEVLAQRKVLELRIHELKRLLDASEEDLARMVREKSVDPGVASIHRGVQGLDPGTGNYAKKKELLAVIYRANVELLAQLERELG